MKVLKIFLITLIILIILAGGVTIGGYFYIKNTYEIDLIKTVKEFKTLSETVDENELCDNAFSDTDTANVQSIINQSVENFITYSSENGYSVNFDNLPQEMKQIITLSDKQLGALAQMVIKQETDGEIKFGEKSLDVSLKQVKFSDIKENSVLINTVVFLNITPLKEDIPENFPFSFLKRYVPDSLYVSSTVKLEKGLAPFSYTVYHDCLTINNLSKDETEDLFHTLDIVLEAGSAENWNVNIGTAVANALIGDENNNGLAYSLKDIGATDYKFLTVNSEHCFVVIR